ncbi:MAG: Rnase Y domain-containing protein [Myxococcota bacterium]
MALIAGAAATLLVLGTRRSHEKARARIEAEGILAAARAEADALKREGEVAAREGAHEVLAASLEEARARSEEARRVEERLVRRDAGLGRREAQVAEHAKEVDARRGALAEADAKARAVREDATRAEGEWRSDLARAAGETALQVRTSIVESLVEDTKARAASRLRNLDTDEAEALERDARRVMALASERFCGHYLTERLLGVIPIQRPMLERVLGVGESNLRAIEEVANVKLGLLETGEAASAHPTGCAVRLEGLDGIAREVARRTLARLAASEGGDARRIAQAATADLQRETLQLGRRAFGELGIPLAHPEIVELVGKLNWRTSYTQNQWKHALEAGFLAGMFAAELGCDVKLARRGALLHDIGKSLTHELDGSHAVIGADIARRLGEAEVVANAIGSHHGEEPFNTYYALLVTAADAMSGGRPGARRQQDDSFGRRVEDMERIAAGFRGVEQVFAVQGGRELRVYVRDREVNDEGCGFLSSEIAKEISEQLVFPGQIKITVIREMRATEIAS